jgi:hypothetical protein
MPSTESIERIHEQLTPLGDEPRVAAERGEIIEPPPRPDENLDDDLSSLLDDVDSDSEEISQEQATEEAEGQDTSELLSNLDSLFDEDEDETETGDTAGDEGLDAGIDLGDDDFPSPPDFSFDPDDIPDELPDEPEPPEEPEPPDEQESEEEFPAESADSEDSADSADDTAATDDATEADFDEDILSAFSDDLDTDPFADLAALEGEGSESEPAPDDAGEEEPDELGESDASDEPGDIGDIDDLGDFGDIGDLGDLDDDTFADDASDDSETADAESLDADEPPSEADETEADEFEDLDDLGDIVGDEGFGSDFGDQIDEDFGDIDLDDSDLSEDPLAGGDVESFDLPSDDDIQDLENVDEFESFDDEGFSLGDFGEEFDINEESIDEFAGLETDVDEGGEGIEEVAGAGEGAPERELSDDEFRHVQQTLASLPLNVKIAAEEAIADSTGTADQTNELINLLIGGASPAKIAHQLSQILNRRVEVPKGYQKRSGLAFQEEKETLSYRLRYVILPFLGRAALVVVATAIVGLLVHRFVYRPIHAAILYRQGYEQAQDDRYELANDTFERAYELRRRDEWFKRYAELYESKRQYQLAVEKYDQLVFGMDPEVRAFLRGKVADNELIESIEGADGVRRQVYDLLTVDDEAILDHGALQSETLANYRRAEELYDILLFGDEYHYDALMARGANYMRWAEEDAQRYEDARQTYARLLARYGQTDAILMQFLRYFTRVDNQSEVERLTTVFLNSPEAEVDPQIYANAAGYLLDKGRIADIREMLIQAFQADNETPEVHYELARYNRRVDAPTEERDALDNAQEAFLRAEPLSPRRLRKQIDTDIRSGEYWYERDELLRATEEYVRAQNRYTQALEAGFLDPTAELARVFARLGDIDYYHSGEFDRALQRYDRAAADGFVPDDLEYKRGFLHYRGQRYDQAAEHFFDIGTSNDLVGPDTVLYARANTLFQRENYFGAQAFYRELLDRLQRRRDQIRTLLVEEDPDHRALVENLIRVHNNLGVAIYQAVLREDPQDPDISEALNHLRESTELRENYLREDETGERAAATTLGFLNIREILYPTEQYEPQIFSELPRDMEQAEL